MRVVAVFADASATAHSVDAKHYTIDRVLQGKKLERTVQSTTFS